MTRGLSANMPRWRAQVLTDFFGSLEYPVIHNDGARAVKVSDNRQCVDYGWPAADWRHAESDRGPTASTSRWVEASFMKVLHVTQGYAPALGGTELLIQRVSEELIRQFDDQVTVYTTDCYNGEGFFTPDAPRMKSGWEELNGVRIRRFEVNRSISRVARRVQYPLYRFNVPYNQYVRALAGGPVIKGLTREISTTPADVIAASSFPLLHMFAALRGAEQSNRPCVLHGGLHPEDLWGFRRSMIFRAIRRADYIANTEFEARYV